MAWVRVPIRSRHEWAPGLVTLTLDVVLERYVAGQFINLGLEIDGVRIKRSYSVASAEGQPCEVFLSLVEEGELTPSLLLLQPGDEVWLDDRALGFFTLEHVPPARDLWLAATGTGLGPYIAMLRSSEIWQRFVHLVLIHGVRFESQLAYADELRSLSASHGGKLRYLALVTRQEAPGAGLRGRIPALIRNGTLETSASLSLDAAHSHVMLCGNPAMLTEAQVTLSERGLLKHRKRKPGHVTVESYW